uniref:DUF4371 domain-containing protein n=1 Tax=Amphiprion ocellaris TaxID=80972 RepID=A0AAQ6A7J1_AMPOC
MKPDHHRKGISKQPNQPSKCCKYREEYIQYGFTCIIVNESVHSDACTREFKAGENAETLENEAPLSSHKASYEVAYLVARAKKPHTIGETLIKPAAVAMCRTMHGDKQAQEMEVPLSDGTISRRITYMVRDIKCQLIDRVKKGKYTLQLDESLDVSNSANLLVFVRYSFGGKLNEDMLFCTPLEAKCTDEDIFTKLDSKLKEEGLSWDQCIGVCTDGASAMLAKKKGLKARVLQVVPHVNFTHCIIHREALPSKTLDLELNSVLETTIKMVNYIKSHPLNTRLFTTLCSELGLEHQGENTNILSLNDKIHSFKRKVDLQKEYPQRSRAAMDILTPFGCTYLCEKMFSALTYIKNKYRSHLNMENDLRVAVSKIKPRIDLLCSTHSVHPSH